ncbi:MAG: GerMN domain-containing protein [Clostridiales bacterium]|nr:GerMN domain-containing protein [Clostridiales bacterium]
MAIKKLVCLLLTILLACALLSCSNGKNGKPDPVCVPTEAPAETPDAEATFRRSTLYFVSDEGFIVPVSKLIPWETGIAKACLACLVSTPENASAAREMGLVTSIPEGAGFTISIRDGNALVDMTGEWALPSAEAELNMIETIVNTLTEFPTVSTVTITRNGSGGRLENGAELPVRQGAYPLNPENEEIATMAGVSEAVLWFPNMSGAVTVPVTKYMGKEPTAYSVVSALIEGSKQKGLRPCFPENTLLLGAAVENGRATVNLSEDFKAVKDTEGLYSLAYRTVFLTLSELYDIDSLEIQVNGERFAPEDAEPQDMVNPAGMR